MASSKRPNASGVNEFFESDANELGCETRRGKRRRTLGTTSLGVDEAECFQEVERIKDISDHFEVLETIGSGTFSTVFKARFKHEKLQDQYVALKCIVRSSSPERIEREIECLFTLSGDNPVANVLGVVRDRDTVVLILDYFEHEPFKSYFYNMEDCEVRAYMQGLLSALCHVHAKGIIHRDVKPSNFLYSRSTNTYLLVDFGLAQKIGDDGVLKSHRDSHIRKRTVRARKREPCTLGLAGAAKGKDSRKSQRANRSGTRGFRAPEVLMKCELQSCAIDVWSAGVIFLSLLSGRFPFFLSGDDTDAFAEIATCFGVDQLKKAGKHLGKDVLISGGQDIQFPPDALTEKKPRKRLKEICQRLRRNGPDWSDEAYELLSKLMALNPKDRITAADALKHPYFTTAQ